jgi:hypothetical protein
MDAWQNVVAWPGKHADIDVHNQLLAAEPEGSPHVIALDKINSHSHNPVQ